MGKGMMTESVSQPGSWAPAPETSPTTILYTSALGPAAPAASLANTGRGDECGVGGPFLKERTSRPLTGQQARPTDTGEGESGGEG